MRHSGNLKNKSNGTVSPWSPLETSKFEGIISQLRIPNGQQLPAEQQQYMRVKWGLRYLWEQVGRSLKRNQAQGKQVPLSSLPMWVLVRAALCPLHIKDQKPTERQEELPPPPPPEVEPVVPKAPPPEDIFPVPFHWCGRVHQLDLRLWDPVSGKPC